MRQLRLDMGHTLYDFGQFVQHLRLCQCLHSSSVISSGKVMVARMSPKLVVKEGLRFLYVTKRLRIFTVVDSQDSSKQL